MEQTKLVLGTVQLGMKYGVNNTSGQPDYDEAFAILDEAWKGGIRVFDTAPAYGTAEEVLGSWVGKRNRAQDIRIISKLKSDIEPSAISTELHASITRLQVPNLDGYMLHAADDMYDEALVSTLKDLKNHGARHIGVSLYGPEQALDALEKGFDYLQVPFNVFDRRLDQRDFFSRVKEKNVTVFARSPFLQGLLLMDPFTLPAHLARAEPYLTRFRELAQSNNLTPLQAALSYVCSLSQIDYVVFGVERHEQLREILAVGDMPASMREQFEAAFRDVDEFILNPSLWRKK